VAAAEEQAAMIEDTKEKVKETVIKAKKSNTVDSLLTMNGVPL